MKFEKKYVQLIVFVALILFAIISRFWLDQLPNVKPVAAVALLAGFCFQKLRYAVAVPLLVMLASDWQLGTYDTSVMFAVYGSMILCAVIGFAASRLPGARDFGARSTRLLGAALLMSVVFFLLTNLAVWFAWYERSWTGLVSCYVAAVPFFKYTLLGNLFFTASGWCVVSAANRWLVKEDCHEAEEALNLN